MPRQSKGERSVNLKLPVEAHERLRRAAGLDGLAMTDFARVAVNRAVEARLKGVRDGVQDG